MTLQKLAAIIAKKEGKRSQAKIHDIKESLGILFDLMAEEIAQIDTKAEFVTVDAPISKIVSDSIYKKAEKLKKKKAKKK